MGLTKADMYDKKGKCILPFGPVAKKYRSRSKYCPLTEDKKHVDQALRRGAKIMCSCEIPQLTGTHTVPEICKKYGKLPCMWFRVKG